MATEYDRERTEPAVPNSSELQTPGSGRPPSATDDELIAAGIRFHAQTGRIPRIDDIVQAVGGAQRSRAARARRAVAQRIANQSAAQWVNVSPEFEAAVRRLLGEFIAAAEASVTRQIEDRVSQTDQEMLELKDIATSSAAQVTSLSEAQRAQEAQMTQLREELARTKQSLVRARQQARRYKVQADERQHTIDLLSAKAS